LLRPVPVLLRPTLLSLYLMFLWRPMLLRRERRLALPAHMNRCWRKAPMTIRQARKKVLQL
jgi:hypothetical protein